jgi:aerotaxis receptor
MRKNLPVTQREYPFPEGTTLMSTTDLKSRITYANAAFVQVSGFERDELVGQPHNIVRHPDMPQEAFADMWATLKAGKSWTALVKNRRKDGDHYWVRANATPIRRGGSVIGYMSVRTKPSRAEIDAAEQLYRRLREGSAGALTLRQGVVVRRGWSSFLTWHKVLPLRWRIRMLLLATAAVMWALGVTGVSLWGPLATLSIGALLTAAAFEVQIARPIAMTLAQAEQVASGQPAEAIALDRVDEIGLLMRAVNQAGLNLRSLVDDVSEQVSGVSGASTEIAAGNGDLSARTEQTAANLQQTAASMEQLAGTIRNNAQSAQQATQLAAEASSVAESGGQAVGQVVVKMRDITDASRRIGDIIGVIDSIAFQTNILALNAAVEAARAGEQGRGFAVVAGEVRNLAQRSAQAAKEIKALIADSMNKVEAGASEVQVAGQTIERIVAQVRRVADLINGISAATQEQSAGVAQINQAVAQLDSMTQQNAALVEQTAAASESLKGQAARLADAVAVFKMV